ncbi:MAG: FAD-dependent oxidoreductase [Steroidobacteraceae bacterium]
MPPAPSNKFSRQRPRRENRSHQWAGIRPFVIDRSPVVGFDPHQPGLFWHAALGGYGIQTAPALSRAVAALVMGKPIEDALLSFGVTEAALSPSRLAHHSASN